MAKGQSNQTVKIRAITAVLFLCFITSAFFYPHFATETLGSNLEAVPTPRPKAKTQARQTRKAKLSEFPHNVKAHNLACNSCHKFPSANWKTIRKADAAFPDITEYPRHESCLNCHRQQFFKGSPPQICSICHTNPSPRDSSRHPFPNPREIFDLSAKGKRHVTDFAISFPHDKHIDIVGENANPPKENRNGKSLGASFVKAGLTRAAENESCSVCHQTYQPQGESEDEYFTKPPANLGDAFWLKKGTFKTVPIGHAQCFTCHSQEAGILPAPTNCNVCHKLKPAETKSDFDAKIAAPMNVADKIMLTAWRKRDSSATFRHEFSSHAEQSCSNCHNLPAMNTLDAQTKKVAITSCNACHITATSDDGGILNFEIDSRKTNPNFQCVKCHIAYGKSPVPESHLKAIVAAGK